MGDDCLCEYATTSSEILAIVTAPITWAEAVVIGVALVVALAVCVSLMIMLTVKNPR